MGLNLSRKLQIIGTPIKFFCGQNLAFYPSIKKMPVKLPVWGKNKPVTL